MKKCKKCEIEFEPKKGLINYCSLACRNSRTWTEDDKIKKSNSGKNSDKVKLANKKTAEARGQDFWAAIKKIRGENRKKEILEANYCDLVFEKLRERIIYEQYCKCNKCGLGEWLGVKIPLELEHKDGNHFNNERNNLEMLCPNCHALTDTWRGRNKNNNNRYKVTDEKLLEKLLLNNWNMRKSLIDVNLAAKGGNYNRCHRLKNEFNKL